MVGQFVRNGQIASGTVFHDHEVLRQGNDLVAHAEGHGRTDGRGFYKTDIARISDRARIAQNVAPHPAVARDAPAEQQGGPAEPQRQEQFGPGPGRLCGERLRDKLGCPRRELGRGLCHGRRGLRRITRRQNDRGQREAQQG